MLIIVKVSVIVPAQPENMKSLEAFKSDIKKREPKECFSRLCKTYIHQWASFKRSILSFYVDYIVFVFYFRYIGQPVVKIRRDLTFRGELDDFTNKVF